MAVFKLGSFSDFGGVVAPVASVFFVSSKNQKVWSASHAAAFCLPATFSGRVEIVGDDFFAVAVSFEGIGDKEVGSFGLTWRAVEHAYAAAAYVETDEEPMVESEWFSGLYDDFVYWVLSKL